MFSSKIHFPFRTGHIFHYFRWIQTYRTKEKYYSWKRDFNFKWTLFHISQKYFYRPGALSRFWTLDFFNTTKWHLERNRIFYRKNTYLFSFLCFTIFSKEARKRKVHSINILIICGFFWLLVFSSEERFYRKKINCCFIELVKHRHIGSNCTSVSMRIIN